jgi:fucose permease
MNPTAVIRVCKLSVFLFSVCTTLLAPLVLSIGNEFNIGLQGCGVLFSFFFTGNFIACAFCGKILSKFGKCHVLRFSLISMAVLSGMMFFAPRFSIICAVLFFLGFITLIIQVAGTSIPSEIITGNTASVMAGVQAFCALGSGSGLLWSGALMTLGYSWRICYLSFSLLSLVGASIAYFVSFPKLQQKASGNLKELISLVNNPKFRSTFLCLFLYSGAESAIGSWLVTYLKQDLKVSSLSSSAVTCTIWAFLFLGRLFCSRIVHIVPRRYILMILILGSTICTFAIPHLNGVAIWFAAAFLGFLMSGIWPLVGANIIDDTFYDKGTSLSIALLFSFLACSIIPYLIGVSAGWFGLSVAISIIGGVFAILFVFFLLEMGYGKI